MKIKRALFTFKRALRIPKKILCVPHFSHLSHCLSFAPTPQKRALHTTTQKRRISLYALLYTPLSLSLSLSLTVRTAVYSTHHTLPLLTYYQVYFRNNTLQHTATHCNTLQHTATHCNTLQHTATHRTAVYSTLSLRTIKCISTIISAKEPYVPTCKRSVYLRISKKIREGIA